MDLDHSTAPRRGGSTWTWRRHVSRVGWFIFKVTLGSVRRDFLIGFWRAAHGQFSQNSNRTRGRQKKSTRLVGRAEERTGGGVSLAAGDIADIFLTLMAPPSEVAPRRGQSLAVTAPRLGHGDSPTVARSFAHGRGQVVKWSRRSFGRVGRRLGYTF